MDTTCWRSLCAGRAMTIDPTNLSTHDLLADNEAWEAGH